MSHQHKMTKTLFITNINFQVFIGASMGYRKVFKTYINVLVLLEK
jgi:hypothetical protein